MWRRVGQMKPEEVVARITFGVLLIGSSFFPWGRWVALALGVLFLISAFQGFCLTCWLYKVFAGKPK